MEARLADSPAGSFRRDRIFALSLVCFVTAVTILSIYRQRPPMPTIATEPSEFSTAGAMKHLSVIAQKPHPIGSTAEDEVRDHLIKTITDLGLTPSVQRAELISKSRNRTEWVNVRNVIARLKGRSSWGKAVMLVAHYDSAPNSPGANDNGAGVAALLETLRALKSGPALMNDIIFLFTDGEEIGLRGARAFVEEHPWAKEVGLVLNFEARGGGGPVFMFETGEQNGWLIREFGNVAPYPFSNSLLYTIYKLLPNDTDFSVFKRAGLTGLNFAYFEKADHYHNVRDSLNYLNQAGLQHHGSYAVALARHFGNVTLENVRAEDMVYFDVVGMLFVSYPKRLALALGALLILLFAAVARFGYRNGGLKLKGVALGFAALLSGLVGSITAVMLAWRVISSPRQTSAIGAHGKLLLIGYLGLAACVITAIIILFRRWTDYNNLGAGSLMFLLCIATASGLLLPGSSYLLMWPLLFGIAVLFLTIRIREGDEPSIIMYISLIACVTPGIVMLACTTNTIFQGLGVRIPPLFAVAITLMIGLFVPLLRYLPIHYKWLVPVFSLAISISFLLAGRFAPVNKVDVPRANSVFYSFNQDNGEALWVTADAKPDEWTEQFFSGKAEMARQSDVFPNIETPLLVSRAPKTDFSESRLDVIEDKTINEVRTVTLKMISHRNVRITSMYVDPTVAILSANINGKRVSYDEAERTAVSGRWWEAAFIAPPEEGIIISLDVKTPKPLIIKLVSRAEGLPSLPDYTVRPRPDYLIPAFNSDITYITRSFTISGGARRKFLRRQFRRRHY